MMASIVEDFFKLFILIQIYATAVKANTLRNTSKYLNSHEGNSSHIVIEHDHHHYHDHYHHYHHKRGEQHHHQEYKSISITMPLSRLTPDEYFSVRGMLLSYEESKALGSDIHLSKTENEANEIIMAAKMAEFEEGFVTPHLFKPSKHIFSVLDAISKSELFKIISKMPKGAILHAHDFALVSTDYLISLTYRPNLWMCVAVNRLGTDVDIRGLGMRFSLERPTIKFDDECDWELLATIREKRSSSLVDNYLKNAFSLYPTEKFEDGNAAWQKFRTIFAWLRGLVNYAPIVKEYFYQSLKEFYADGVQYLEFRSTVPQLYDLNGNVFNESYTVLQFEEALQSFKKDNPDFIGGRMIYAPHRHVGDEMIEHYIKNMIEFKAQFPNFVAGFDLVGQENLGRPLKDFIPKLLSMQEDIDFFFHAGETNWHGSTVDENLIDAILLGTKRIGHGFGIVKHPLVLEMVKERNIAIEVSPISNQVLTLVSDYRNHPCAHLFSNNYPVVISSDDPSFWKATPLSHDFYIAFLGIASTHSDLRLLKKLAINSIAYSAMSDLEKAEALIKWEKKWESFIEMLINNV